MKRSILPLVALALVFVSACSGASAVAAGPRASQGSGDRIAFTQGSPDGGPVDLMLVNPTSGEPEQISVEDPPELFSFPVWSPDGSKILLSHTFRLDLAGNCCLPFRPAIVNPDGSGFTLLTMAYGPPDMDCAAWTPDQTRILCGFGGAHPGVFSVNASNGRNPVRLTTSPYGSSDQGAKELPTAVSPDGSRFLFIRFKPARTERAVEAALFVENMDGSGLRQLTPFGFMFPHDDQAWASWSPDGTKIISTTARGRLFTVNPDGKQLNVIDLKTTGSQYFAFDPHWSPDGSQIVFGMFTNGTVHLDGNTSRDATEDLYTANADGSKVTQITHDSDVQHSPDWGVGSPGA